MTQELNVVATKSIYELVKSGYGEYQQFVNDGKFIPGLDGMKKVQRRYLLAVRESAKTKFQKSNFVLGVAMGKYHPHEVQLDVLYSLVRGGLVAGQGNFGLNSVYSNLASAAMRYTEVKYNNKIDNLLFKFENYFIYQEGENGYKEPEFLITPVPFALLRGSIGIGVGGVRTKIPAFTYESILDAYRNDDPSLLKSAYGLKIDYEESNLKSLWEKGHGKLIFKFDYRKRNDGSVELSGDATIAKPDIRKLRKWEKAGYLTIDNESTDKMKLIFSRNKGIRKITDKDILDEVKKAAVIDGPRSTYIIMFSHNKSAIKLGIKKWLDLTMGIYYSTFEKWKATEIKKTENQIAKLHIIPEVAELLRQGESTKSISGKLGKTMKLISSIEQLPLRMLRKTDFTSSIKTQEKKLDAIRATKVESLVDSGVIVDELLGKY